MSACGRCVQASPPKSLKRPERSQIEPNIRDRPRAQTGATAFVLDHIIVFDVVSFGESFSNFLCWDVGYKPLFIVVDYDDDNTCSEL